eukprot:CAMPEP_0206019052 /NCGR_PEP_ID=MMETSP1464-20131121/28358_1 /ASSEMBLY_ACC=CAM_ASM_001124 /TAXON_ID=119497 /ORGANISM="Exanthemachrysis gayraliae, Strain RCC1523" /LENGTH=125 /DNA_ID=CAMNT_0053392943 /DNA_START=1 /DNA_END=378 /DNA_ORIENTATION=-
MINADEREVQAAKEAITALGWRLEPGVKYGAQFLAYESLAETGVRGARDHARHCVNVVAPAGGERTAEEGSSDAPLTWYWLKAHARVSNSVRKSLLLAHVGTNGAVSGVVVSNWAGGDPGGGRED